jgi:hypothetical protein
MAVTIERAVFWDVTQIRLTSWGNLVLASSALGMEAARSPEKLVPM